MSVLVAHSDPARPEPEWVKEKSVSDLGRMVSNAQIHVSNHHKRQAEWRLVDLLAEMALSFLDGAPAAPESWRPRLVETLERIGYQEGCCTWRG